MAMPQLLFLGLQSLIDVLGDHVLNADEASVLLARVINEALAEVFTDVRAEMMGLDGAGLALARLVGVDVHRVEKLADVVEGFEIRTDGLAGAAELWF